MNRELKFRAWDKKGVMIFQPPLVEVAGKYRVMGSNPEEVIIMQYTGLKDKNGVEIYEGDIVQDSDDERKEVVKFDDGYFFPLSSGDSCGCCSHMIFEPEVIGNIYENPELL